MLQPFFLEENGDDGVARITLTRPDLHNAFNAELIEELTAAFDGIQSDDRVRALVLASKGKSFSAGADLNWMKSMAGNGEDENLEDARKLAALMRSLDRLGKPTIALVQGAAYGGGVGLAACCDIVIASEQASFCLSEVKLGLVPAVISPYVVAAIGPRAARRYFLTAERFSAWEAQRMGLVHEVVETAAMERTCRQILGALLAGGPKAQEAAKDLVFSISAASDDLIEETARLIAKIRVSDEGQEGIAAFLEKRKPNWTLD